MNKKKFLKLLKNPGKINTTSLQELEELVEAYPYAQVLHILLAKAHQASGTEIFPSKLNHAALYTADRKNLKGIMEGQYLDDNETDAPAIEDDPVEETVQAPSTEDPYQGVEKELKSYIKKVKEEKKALEQQDEEGISNEFKEEKNNFIKELDIKIAEAEAKLQQVRPKEAKENDTTNDTISDEEKKPDDNDAFYEELQENLASLKEHKSNFQTEEEVKSEEQEKQPNEQLEQLSNNVEREKMEEYLSSLKAKKEKAVEGEHLSEQIKLINKFIENEPKLSKLENEDDGRVKREDLSLNSLKLDSIYPSENLAMIMAKQGKIEKAEEIYNKLIWKFPEKKAYFVARIEELKKK